MQMPSSTTEASPQQVARAVGSVARVGRYAYVGLAWLFVVAVLVQVFLAGLYVFGPTANTWIAVHIMTGHIFELFPVLILVAALVGRLSLRMTLLSLLLLVLYGLQYAFINLQDVVGSYVVAAFHPVNALLIFALSLALARGSLRFLPRGA